MAPVDIAGVWSGPVHQDLADHLTPEGSELQAAIGPEDDPGIQCAPFGFFRKALSPLTVQIGQDDDRITFIDDRRRNRARSD